ncbi:hypothetical protein [Mesorhizobium sp. B2-3-15]|uniref:hypothetical protein n=1 Tax=Mesorhizobium sp. B2-3-15 TaxID=2589949 RepID=UPI001129F85F|nr:hypothetical protein [Mesorhizobium sp. B2-3-15]TPL75118.1 hypothetical protein FJ954_09180 [Mesorhizobium sp. B2-3-15]
MSAAVTLDDLKAARDKAAARYQAVLADLSVAYADLAGLDIALAQLSGSAEIVSIGKHLAKLIREQLTTPAAGGE